jgi:hypothetical protein
MNPIMSLKETFLFVRRPLQYWLSLRRGRQVRAWP